MRIYQLCYKGPVSPYGPPRGFILTVSSNHTTTPQWTDIKKALEDVGFRDIHFNWYNPNNWDY